MYLKKEEIRIGNYYAKQGDEIQAETTVTNRAQSYHFSDCHKMKQTLQEKQAAAILTIRRDTPSPGTVWEKYHRQPATILKTGSAIEIAICIVERKRNERTKRN